MKKIRIIITMTCLMLTIATSAQHFNPPPSRSKTNAEGNKASSTTATSSPKKSMTKSSRIQPKKTESKTLDGSPRDLTTGSQVTGIERSSTIEELENQAKKGDIMAHTQLGMYYYQKNEQKALPHLIAGAEAGNPLAQYYLGGVYYTGKFEVEVDKTRAATYFLLSAQQNHVPAQYGIAICLYNGDGMPQNRKAARLWMEKAAHNNYADAKIFLETHSFE